MKLRYRYPILVLLAVAGILVAVFAQSSGYTPGEFQSTNPNYPKPNPFYFEGKIDWNLLGITTPQNAWEYLQRGMHFQDDMDDVPDAISDYQTALSMNSLQSKTCKIVTIADLVMMNGTLTVPTQITPAPCMFTLRLRLGYLMRETSPSTAIGLFQEVLQIDPQRIGVNTLIAETYVIEAQQATDPATQQQAYANAIAAYQAELALSPVTPQSTALTGDTANNSKVHWELAQAYVATGQNSLAKNELQSYLQATKWHSDVYPWRIALANSQIQSLARLK
jgi:Tfp pilus assembly protein PilF